MHVIWCSVAIPTDSGFRAVFLLDWFPAKQNLWVIAFCCQPNRSFIRSCLSSRLTCSQKEFKFYRVLQLDQPIPNSVRPQDLISAKEKTCFMVFCCQSDRFLIQNCFSPRLIPNQRGTICHSVLLLTQPILNSEMFFAQTDSHAKRIHVSWRSVAHPTNSYFKGVSQIDSHQKRIHVLWCSLTNPTDS